MKRVVNRGLTRGRQGRNRCQNFRSRVGIHFRIGFVGIGSRASIKEWPVKGEFNVLIDEKGKGALSRFPTLAFAMGRHAGFPCGS
jgi:hypothetical protein